MPQIEIMEKQSSNILLSLSFIPITDRVLGLYFKLRTDSVAQIEITEKQSSNILLSLSFIPITDRVRGPYYKLRTDFYHVDVWPRAKCVGHTRSVHNYQRSLSRNKPNSVFFPYFQYLLSIPD